MSDSPDGPSPNAPTLDAVIALRFSRRDLMRGSLAAALAAGLAPQAVPSRAEAAEMSAEPPAFDFPELTAGVDEHLHVAEGYEAKPLLRWGDPLFADAPAFDPRRQSAAGQERQFGYNNDFVGFIPLDAAGRRGLLVVNHEYTNAELMFPGLAAADRKGVIGALSPEQVAVEMAAHGGSVVEIVRDDEGWRPVIGSPYTRRITAQTPIDLTGPPRAIRASSPRPIRAAGACSA